MVLVTPDGEEEAVIRKEGPLTTRELEMVQRLMLSLWVVLTITMMVTHIFLHCFRATVVKIRIGGRGQSRFKRGRYEGDFSRGARPPRPHTDSIVVARIPPELNTIDKLNEHFKKFGNIVNIQVPAFPMRC